MTWFLVKHCFRYLVSDGIADDIDGEDRPEDNDEDPDDETDDYEDSKFDVQQFKEQVLKIQQKAATQFSALPHRETKLINRAERKQ